MGVKASNEESNGKMGPLADKLYAVDPAGVETNMPSQMSSGMTALPLTEISSFAA
jgi:hypothetical protein